jgi:hypothetical protein
MSKHVVGIAPEAGFLAKKHRIKPRTYPLTRRLFYGSRETSEEADLSLGGLF